LKKDYKITKLISTKVK